LIAVPCIHPRVVWCSCETNSAKEKKGYSQANTTFAIDDEDDGEDDSEQNERL